MATQRLAKMKESSNFCRFQFINSFFRLRKFHTKLPKSNSLNIKLVSRFNTPPACRQFSDRFNGNHLNTWILINTKEHAPTTATFGALDQHWIVTFFVI